LATAAPSHPEDHATTFSGSNLDTVTLETWIEKLNSYAGLANPTPM